MASVGISNVGLEERNGNIVYWRFSCPRSLTNLSNLKSNSKKLHSSGWTGQDSVFISVFSLNIQNTG